jgi:hypothetical protein
MVEFVERSWKNGSRVVPNTPLIPPHVLKMLDEEHERELAARMEYSLTYVLGVGGSFWTGLPPLRSVASSQH